MMEEDNQFSEEEFEDIENYGLDNEELDFYFS